MAYWYKFVGSGGKHYIPCIDITLLQANNCENRLIQNLSRQACLTEDTLLVSSVIGEEALSIP